MLGGVWTFVEMGRRLAHFFRRLNNSGVRVFACDHIVNFPKERLVVKLLLRQLPVRTGALRPSSDMHAVYFETEFYTVYQLLAIRENPASKMSGARMTKQIPGDNYEFQRSQYKTVVGDNISQGQTHRFFVIKAK